MRHQTQATTGPEFRSCRFLGTGLKRAELVREAQRVIISKDPPMVHTFSGYGYTAFWDYVKGQQPEMRSLALYNKDFWLDK